MSYLHLGQNNRPFFWDVSRGQVEEHKRVFKFGRNGSVSNTGDGIWSSGGPFLWHTTASTLDVTSDDATDTVLGNGARYIHIEGLDINFNELTESIPLNGLGTVTTTGEFLRVNRAYISEVGVYAGSNVGTITVTRNVDADIMCEIGLTDLGEGFGTTQISKFTVPKGFTASVLYANVTVFSTKQVTLTMNVRNNNAVIASASYPSAVPGYFDGLSGSNLISMKSSLEFAEFTDIWWDGWTATGTAEVSVYFEIILTKK